MEETCKATIMDGPAMSRALVRIAHEIIERNEGSKNLALVGIIRRGETLANRLADAIAKIEGERPELGSLDISFYHDDITHNIAPVVHSTNLPFSVDERDIVLASKIGRASCRERV